LPNVDVMRSLRRADLEYEQRRVIQGVVIAILVGTVALLGSYLFVPFPRHGTANVAERIALALRVDILVFAWLIAAIANVGTGRFFSRDDIQGAGFYPPSERLVIPVAILQNTLEQTVLAVGAHLILATMLMGQELILLPVLALLFCVGRAAFWVGYRGGAGRRAFGFALTFYPTLLAYVLAIILLIRRG
jgi:uncharacterized membrane protein YecN with MAPEG domain